MTIKRLVNSRFGPPRHQFLCTILKSRNQFLFSSHIYLDVVILRLFNRMTNLKQLNQVIDSTQLRPPSYYRDCI